MTINSFVDTIAAKLKTLWPGRKVFVNEVPQKIDGNFFIKVIDAGQGKKLNRRRERGMSFDVSFFLKNHDTLSYLAWAEQMLAKDFELLEVGGNLYHVTGMSTNISDRVGHALFSINFNTCYPAEPVTSDTAMQTLQLNEEVENG